MMPLDTAQPHYFYFPTISNNNLEDAGTFEVEATAATLNLEH